MSRILNFQKSFDQKTAMIIVVSVWAGVASWHPAYLGFFSDDWVLFVRDLTTAEMSSLVTSIYPDYPQILIQTGIAPTIVAARPGYGLLLFSLKSLLSDSPVAWQIASALILLGAAYSLFLFVVSLAAHLGCNPEERVLGATVTTIVYLIGPWSVVMGSWPTISITLISQIMVTFGLRRLLSPQTFFPLSAIFLLLFGFLVYEAYWLLFVPVAIVLLAAPDWKRSNLVRFVTVVLFVLILALLIKTGLAKWWNISQKSLSTEWLPLFFANMRYLDVIKYAIHPAPPWFFWLSLITIMIASGFLTPHGDRRLLTGYLALAAGLSSSAFWYALVGYGLTGTGVMSRSVAAQNVYFSIFIGFLWACAARRFFKESRISGRIQAVAVSICFLGSLGLISTLTIGTIARSCEWSELWKAELTVLSRFPDHLVTADLRGMKNDQRTMVIVQIDEDTRGAIFGASWEIEGALAWKYPILKKEMESARLTFLVAREAEWSTVWDGQNIIQKWCGTDGKVVSTAKADRVQYVRVARNGVSNYNAYPLNRATGCLKAPE